MPTWKEAMILTVLALASILLVPILVGYMTVPAEWR